MIKDYIILAFRNLKRRGLRSYLTLLGIFIGIAVVVALIGLGDGLRMAVNSQFGVSTTQVLTVQAGGLSGYGLPGTGVVNSLTKDDVTAIEKISGVEIAIPRNIETVKVEFNKKLIVGYAASLPKGEDREAIYETLDLTIQYGQNLKDSDTFMVVLGNDFSQKEKSGFDKAVKVGDKLIIQGKEFRVAGMMEKKGSFILDRVILMDEDELRSITTNDENVDIIAVKVRNKDDIEKVKSDIENLLRERRNVKKGEEDFQVSTPQAMLTTVNQVLLGVQIFIVIIALISIIVGAIGIVNTMTTSVLERKKEIGIMKAIGARNSDIFLQFLIEAGLLGLLGGFLGIIFGSLISYLGVNGINSFIGSTIRPKIDFMLIGFSLLGSFLVGAVSGLTPAMRAARLRPVEVLRQ
ncbi:ABC transporter permease [Candidatus Pacearchaeota archaeon]|nr:ABC transporter permease [Candidatus Pacearchaeota archaeon]